MISSSGIIPTDSLSVLSNKTILITRSAHQAQSLAQNLKSRGAKLLFQPAIEILPPEDWSPLDNCLNRLDEYDYLVFSSVNGVDFFFQRAEEKGIAIPEVSAPRVAAIGSSTAEALKQKGITSVLTPPSFRAEELADLLIADMNARKYSSDGTPKQGEETKRVRFLLLRASRGREILAERLREANADVEQAVVYRSIDVKTPNPDITDALRRKKVDWVVITSSSIAASTAKVLGQDLNYAKIVAISPLTSEVMRKLGFNVELEATEYTMEGIVDAITEYETRNKK